MTHHHTGEGHQAATSKVGTLIKSQREALGLSRRELARRAGVDHAYLSRVERGVYEPTSRWVNDVTKALGAELGARVAANIGGAA